MGMENGEESETIAVIDDSSDLQEVDETEEPNEELHEDEEEHTEEPDEELHEEDCPRSWPSSATRLNHSSPLEYQLNLANSTTMYAELTGTKGYHGGKQ